MKGTVLVMKTAGNREREREQNEKSTSGEWNMTEEIT
jgi:hypothetical protein